ncbi:MAG: hypothetical protein HY861_00585 [Chlamydiia bacterium]|nr:hypothetical protein [Chlamydiia bacterium]
MNFTREPIIETVITPREGCKLLVRNSKGSSQDDYYVEAVEVVSFGRSFFFRSSERPKSFLVPVSDYEVLELKETKMALKNVAPERSIKIGGGREAPRPSREAVEEADFSSEPQQAERPPMERDRRREKRRRGRRGGGNSSRSEQQQQSPAENIPVFGTDEAPGTSPTGEPVKAPSFISKLFPPPPTLIKETLSRYKQLEGTEGGEAAPHHAENETPPRKNLKVDTSEETMFED